MIQSRTESQAWPQLRFADWADTLATLHMWLQVVGKIRLKQEAHLNHWWEATLYVTARGLTTSPVPYKDLRSFQIDFDFVDHVLSIQDCNGGAKSFALEPMPVAQFYAKVMDLLRDLDIAIAINTKPNEVPDPIPFERDYTHASYDKEYAQRFWRVLIQADRLFKIFRARYVGKASPVHLFWGAPDLAVTRFSGNEDCSAGFWPGSAGMDAAFYAYAHPEPQGFAQAHVDPGAAYYSSQFGEFMLPYESVRTCDDPDAAVLTFLQSTYEAAAELGHWDRKALEHS
jgi:hypothetical protein